MTFLCQNVDLFYLYQVLFTCFPFLPRTYGLPPPAHARTHTHTPTPTHTPLHPTYLPTYLTAACALAALL